MNMGVDNVITVEVSDNGSPRMAASQQFTVTVNDVNEVSLYFGFIL